MTQACPSGVPFDLGDCLVTPLYAGSIRLDGGAMFGIIPKAIWARLCPADEHNRIQLGCNSLLVEPRGSGRRLIVETGHGSKFGEKEQRLFGIDPSRWLLSSLAACGVDPAGITDVVLTHLHFDHAGGLTMAAADGKLVPTFPNARVHVQRREHDDARANHGIMTITYREENFQAIDAARLWHFCDAAADIAPRVRVVPAPGHTRGQQAVIVEGSAQVLAYIGDVMPTRHHLGPAYNMGYDLHPLDNRETKAKLLGWAADSGALLALDHDPQTPLVRVRRSAHWFELEPVATIGG